MVRERSNRPICWRLMDAMLASREWVGYLEHFIEGLQVGGELRVEEAGVAHTEEDGHQGVPHLHQQAQHAWNMAILSGADT
jgi:hypothetical protein